MRQYGTILFERSEEGVATITLNRPDRLNAISWDMVEEFHDCLTQLENDYGARVVILTGAGRGFCSGTDLKGRENEAPPTVQGLSRRQRRIGDVVLHLRRIPQPVIGAINGVAAGGGFSIAMACDVRIAASGARFVGSFINVGLSGGEMGSSYFLPRLIGLSRAAEILYTGREVSAEEAERIGLVSRVVSEGKLRDVALDLARTMLGKSPFGLRMTKEALNHGIDAPGLEAALALENRTQNLGVLTGDFKVAIEAFQKKERPSYPPEA